MTQFNPQYPGYPGSMPQAAPEQQRRRFPFFVGYFLWFSPAVWRDAGRRWGGIGFFYILVLLAITWAIDMAVFRPRLVHYVQNEVPKLAARVPTIDITNGVASTSAQEPYIINDPQSGKPMFVIDTTGMTTEPPEPNSGLLMRDKLVFKIGGQVQVHPLKDIKSLHIDGSTVQSAFDAQLRAYWKGYYPAALLVSTFLRFLQMLLYGLIALAVASSLRTPLTFAGCMRLAALAITPVILLDTLLWATVGPFVWVWWILAPVLEITLLVFMVRANDDSTAMYPGAGGYFAPPQAPFGAYPPQGYVAQGYGSPAYPAPGSAAAPPPPPPPLPPAG